MNDTILCKVLNQSSSLSPKSLLLLLAALRCCCGCGWGWGWAGSSCWGGGGGGDGGWSDNGCDSFLDSCAVWFTGGCWIVIFGLDWLIDFR